MPQRKHFYWLDLLRFGAAFMVLVAHTRGFLLVEYGALPSTQHSPLVFLFFSVSRLGHEAVLIFFVLSGFLVGGKTIERLKENSFDIQAYLLDRGVRIWLPLISALLLILTINYITGSKTDMITFWGNFFSLQGIYVESLTGPFWSLSYEVWFYIIMGAVALFFSTKFLKSKIGALVVLFICGIIFTKLSFSYLMVWLMGAFAYHLPIEKKNKLLFFSLMICSLLLMFALQITSSSRSVGNALWQRYLDRSVLELLFGLVSSIFIRQLVMYVPKGKAMQRLDKIGTKLADFSYTIYLTNYPILGFLLYCGFPKSTQINSSSIAYYLLGVAICLLSAYAIYWLFEKRTTVVKKFIKEKILRNGRGKDVPAI